MNKLTVTVSRKEVCYTMKLCSLCEAIHLLSRNFFFLQHVSSSLAFMLFTFYSHNFQKKHIFQFALYFGGKYENWVKQNKHKINKKQVSS